jgi:hypothetical protein
MATKSTDTRRAQTVKNLAKNPKKTAKKPERNMAAMKAQAKIIKDDVVKLRNDLQKGYDMAREWMESKSSVRQLLKIK